jgi:D-alanyl-D-alanine carboxypeptidase
LVFENPGLSIAKVFCAAFLKKSGCLAVACIFLSVLLASCAQQGGGAYTSANGGPSYAPTHYYPPPGPPDDPWGPYIVEAAARFQIPQQWIRAVMQQESGGEEQAVSPTGAMGLMQVEPETYQDLQATYGLGADPFDPHNNILAGAAYISEMYQRYGAPGFLAAYNAGPEDVDEYLAGTSSLPDETVNYLAMVTPNLGTEVAFSGPFANYQAGSAGEATPTPADFASGCDENAAYDPDHPCTATAPTSVIEGQPAIVASASAGTCNADNAYDPDDPCSADGSCNINNAYDPDSPCTPAQTAQATQVQTAPAPQVQTAQDETAPAAASSSQPDCGSSAVFNPACPASVVASVDAAPPPPSQAAYQPAAAATLENWGIQVGAFEHASLAQNVAQNALTQLSSIAGNASVAISPTTPFGGNVLYQARLIHLSAQQAVLACSALSQRQLPCVVVRPANA